MKYRLVEKVIDNSLNEGKQDELNLINFAGEDLARRYLKLRQRFKSPENDLYYWIKRGSVEDLLRAVTELENTKSNSQQRKESSDGATLVCDTEHYKVYKINTLEASRKYGRDTRWCVSGYFGDAEYYWNLYTKKRHGDFYFFIEKGDNGDKYALVVFDGSKSQVFNSYDTQISIDYIPHIDEVEIPGVNFDWLYDVYYFCEECNEPLSEDDVCITDDGYHYCEYCFDEMCFWCVKCDRALYKEDGHNTDDGLVCSDCFKTYYTDETNESVHSHKIKFKLVESFEDELNEDIAAVRKNYPTIDDRDFDGIIRLDPTFVEGRDSVGQYGKWLLNLFKKGKLNDEGHIKDLLTRFEENKKYLKNRDIGQFKTPEEVDEYLNNEDNYKDKSHRQEVRDRQKGRKNADLTKDAKVVYQDSDWTVWVPETYEASCKLGQGSSWCTASTESDYYYKLYSRQGDLYIIINNHDEEEKYQFHFESGQFMNIDDYSIHIGDFLNKNEGLKGFFKPILYAEIGLTEDKVIDGKVSASISRSDPDDFVNWFGRQWGEFIYKLLGYDTDPWGLFNSDYFPGIDSVLSLDFPDYVTKALEEAGVTDIEKAYEQSDDFRWVVEVAYSIADEQGSVNAATEDAIDSIEDVGGVIGGDEITFTMSEDELWNFYAETDMDSCDYTYIICEFVKENFSFDEPYAGWYGFDEDVFFEDLVYRLNEIDPIELDDEDEEEN